MIRVTLWISFLVGGVAMQEAFCQDGKQRGDSIVGPHFVITPRFHSAGHFPYTGALINKHVTADLNVFFEYQGYGFFVFKSLDIEDTHSIVNYLQPGIFRKVEFGPQFHVRLFFGYLFAQASGFRDGDSDYYTAAVGYWTITEKLKLENTALFFDLTESGKLANRLLVTWLLKNFRIDVYVWHRWVFASGVHATSSSIALNFPRIRLSDHVYIQNTFSYQRYITESKPDFAMRDGFLFSIAFPMTIRE